MLNTCTLGAQGSGGASTKEIQSSLGLVFLPEAQPASHRAPRIHSDRTAHPEGRHSAGDVLGFLEDPQHQSEEAADD